MGVNGITNNATTDYAATTTAAKTKATETTTDTATSTSASDKTGVVYESSANTTTAAETKKQQNAAIVAKLKADMEEKSAQLENLVKQMMQKQGNSYGEATNMWQFLSKGDFTVDSATKAQAQQDISEDGYWGVKQTSDRILDFAQALAGGDPEKMKEMRSAFEKGYKEATKTWGKELPDITKNTYDSVMEKFDNWDKANSVDASTESQA